jgi:hypothetical protein
MMSPTPPGAAREWVAGILSALPELADVNVYPGPTEQVTAPAVIVTPAGEWLRVATSTRTEVGLALVAAVTWTGGNTAALDALEALVWPILAAFPGAKQVLAPAVTQYGQASLYAATITIPTQVNDTD